MKAGHQMQIVRNGSISVVELKCLIADISNTGPPTLNRVSGQTGVSARSLQRHLEKQGVKYSDIVDDVRLDVAKSLLKQPELNISDVAIRLGYRDHSSFSRAFARWSGTSPRNYRANAR